MFKTRNLTAALAFRVLGIPAVYANEPGWKLDAEGKIEIRDGNPVYIDSAGKELVMGADTISRLNGEARGHRERAETAEAQVRTYKPLIDAGIKPEDALTAVATVKDLNAGDLIKKGEVDRVRSEISASFQKDIDDKDRVLSETTSELNGLHLSHAFKSSKYVADNIAVPVDMLQDKFGKFFKREGGKIVAYDGAGNKVISGKRGGEDATFDEAMELLVGSYEHKDSILKGGNHTGSGNNGNGGAGGGKRIVRRADWEQMDPMQKADTAAKAGAGELQIVE